MFQFILKRCIATLPVVFGVCTLTFLMIHFIPGDPIDIMLGDQASPMDKEQFRQALGLHLPLSTQYTSFLSDLLQLNLGRSVHSQELVFDLIASHVGATVELTFFSMLLAILIGIPFGILSAIRQYSIFDNSLILSSLIGMSVPGFFLGPLLIWIFAIQLGWFPVSERGGFEHLFLPSLSLAIPLGAILLRMTRASMLEVINEDFIQVAKAKGNNVFGLYFKHALRNALMPVITIIGLQVGALLTGTVITETIFDWPGLGTLLFDSINRRDYPVVQGCILLIALTYVFVNLMTDIAYALVNPKIRLTES